MPVQTCQVGGESGHKFGPNGKCFTGPGSREKAAAQGRAIKAREGTSNAETNMETITFNLTGPVRHDTMEGRDYLVAPMVMLTEGVHAGSKGPLFYPKEELSKYPQVWNHKPIVVYHPPNGQSACDPDVLSNRKVGVVMNTHFDGKLRAEAWFEQHRIDVVDSRIGEALEKNELMELSTGLSMDYDHTEGKFDGESYSIIARNYRPDHLAILPDKEGACSVEDGAGLLQTNDLHDPMSHDNIREKLNQAIEEKFGDGDPNTFDVRVHDVFPDFFIFHRDNKLWKLGFTHDLTSVTLSDEEPMEVVRVTEFRSMTGDFVGNVALTTKQINDLPDSTFAVILSGGTKDEGGKTVPRSLRKLPIPDADRVRNALARLSQTSITANQRRTAFRKILAAANRFGVTVSKVTKQKFGVTNDRKGSKMDKNELVDGLIANESSQLTEDDREFLEGLEESQLEKLDPISAKVEDPKPTANEQAKIEAAKAEAAKAELVNNGTTTDQKPVTKLVSKEEYVANAPPEIRDVLNAGLASYARDKASLVQTITENEKNVFTPEQLNAMPIDQLDSIAKLARTPEQAAHVPTYQGAASPTGNSSQKIKPLLLPVMNYGGDG